MVQLTEAIVKGKTRLDKLDDVRNLNMWGQGISDVSILQRCKNVEIVSLSVNDISSLKDFMCCKALKELYLRKNNVASLSDIRYLMCLPQLKVLWLSDNPCAELPDYRAFVVAHLPQLEKLDNVEVTEADRQAAQGLARLQPASSAELLTDSPFGFPAPNTPNALSAQSLQQPSGSAQQTPRALQDAAAAGVQQQHCENGTARAHAALVPAASTDSYSATIGLNVTSAGAVDVGLGCGGVTGSGAVPDLFPGQQQQQQQQQQQYNPQRYSSQPGNQVPQLLPKVLHTYDNDQQVLQQVQEQLQQQPQPPRPSTPNSSSSNSQPTMGSSNVLYAVMALLGDLDAAQLAIVSKEVEQRLAGLQAV